MRLQAHEIKHQSGELCPSCCSLDTIRKKGTLNIKSGRYGQFLSCSRYPDCKYSCKVDKNLENIATQLLKRKAKKTRRVKKLVCKIKESQRRQRGEMFREFERLIAD